VDDVCALLNIVSIYWGE